MKTQSFVFSFLAMLALVGCGTQTGNGGSAHVSTSLRDASSVAARALNEIRAFSPNRLLDMLASAQTVGQSTSTSIKSLKYNLTSIMICQDLTTTGTAYNSPKNCIAVYQGGTNPAFNYDDTKDYLYLAEAARNNSSALTDLMDPNARGALATSTSVSSRDVGSYKYGIINWSPVLQVSGDITVGSTVYRTADGTASGVEHTVTSGDFTTLTSDTAGTVVLGNGGNWFAFQKPFVISDADVSAKTAFAVDLTFNPDGMMRAFPNSITGCGTCNLLDAAGNKFEVPELGLVPIARRATDKTMKEVYQGSVTGTNAGGTDNYDLRVELYYVQSDAAKTIYGASFTVLPNANSNTYVSPFSKISYIGANADGSINFQIFDKTVVFDNFTRGTKVGDTASGTIVCGNPGAGSFAFAGCGGMAGDPTSKSVSLQLVSISSLN